MYADIIVDISHENLDKTYQYAIPDSLAEQVKVGALVKVPFGRGNRFIKGYVVGLSEIPNWDPARIKPIAEVEENGLIIESQLIQLAYWIKDNYGSTMNDALKTVIPVKKRVKAKEKRHVKLIVGHAVASQYLGEYRRKHYTGKVRLLEALIEYGVLDQEIVQNKLSVGRETVKSLERDGLIQVVTEQLYRNPVKNLIKQSSRIQLNEVQQAIADEVITDYMNGIRKTYYVHGITGSGKTEVYMEIIANIVSEGKQVIMLIPEISLTYQTVMRFYSRFGERVSFLHSKLSGGERYDQYLRAKNGEIDIMIGPRSALFTPFQNLGFIIIDEEHEGSYKSENPPKYHAREVALERARLTDSSVLLGSATPSVESYQKALSGEYKLFTMDKRAGHARLPKVWIVDLREELKNKNKSIFSMKLKGLMEDRLKKKQQIMLFLNRRGYAGFVSCRSCGHVMKCPHCDVSLTSHNTGSLVCHYCGHEETMPKACPVCGSRFIAAFGTGTQKVEEMVRKEFPYARVLRMDTDTTSKKGGHEEILSAFKNREADILIGTQMIVKGHDFPNVTLVGVLAADLSLFSSDYRSGERTFQLLAQAAGRAGRGTLDGEVVIQTYQPEHYSIVAAATEDYKQFYEQEIAYRTLMSYPPAEHMVALMITSKEEEKAQIASKVLFNKIEYFQKESGELSPEDDKLVKIIGPVKASVSKINDIYRWVIYLKCKDYDRLKEIKNMLEDYMEQEEFFKKCSVQFDFDPIHSY
ncbi:MAG TPA: primosomal protein N' [Lachnospiraceae bacterium]|mgnify:CR=1 FL=1|nr:primosomal protein N' [uncultured Lachnoclostridium sp.]HAU88051.1 primosomal protein N' [Lachnospiraceae bacterium]